MEKQWFRVAPGVTWVDGARVVGGQRLALTEKQAEFDLGHDRIAPDPDPQPKPAPKRKATDDGGD